ncbi:hypothetical protein BDZ97DRAFT_41546 [Flammula alnicola]|nr:hypothetical protein BDZ97DRAFT_41546 [Flammula alnicola]
MPLEGRTTRSGQDLIPCERPPVNLNTLNNQMPMRTFSDELFSVPIQKTVLSGIFVHGEALDDVQENPPFDCKDVEESVTESETEDELDDKMELHSPHDAPASEPFEAPLQESLFKSHDGEPLASQQRSEFLESLGSSSSSVPLALKEFQDMFGSNDESYPPDFPMSLRS